ncbi:MAG: hypothetical protein WCY34_06965 [Candidatus Omnitrophota bacterium]
MKNYKLKATTLIYSGDILAGMNPLSGGALSVSWSMFTFISFCSGWSKRYF